MTAVAPMHLGNTRQICEAFGVGRETVRMWVKEGAPIYKEGKRLVTEYNRLFEWRLKRERGKAA